MSEIKVDTLTGKTTAGDITVTSEGGTANMQLQQGLVKCWVHYDHDTPAVKDSLNAASVTDVDTGMFDPQYTNSMNSSNYSVLRMGQAEITNADCTQYAYNKATGSVRCYNSENDSAIDLGNTDAAVLGDLA